jgi:hypothetical protein
MQQCSGNRLTEPCSGPIWDVIIAIIISLEDHLQHVSLAKHGPKRRAKPVPLSPQATPRTTLLLLLLIRLDVHPHEHARFQMRILRVTRTLNHNIVCHKVGALSFVALRSRSRECDSV